MQSRLRFYSILGKATYWGTSAEQSKAEENQETSAVISKCRNAGMPGKVSIGISPVVSCFSPASAFRHQGSVRYRWSRLVRQRPAMDFYEKNLSPNTLNAERHIRRMRRKNKLDPILANFFRSKAKKIRNPSFTSYRRTGWWKHLNLLYLNKHYRILAP